VKYIQVYKFQGQTRRRLWTKSYQVGRSSGSN